MKGAGLIYGSDIHHLDHIAPLCSLLDLPLIVTDREIEKLALIFYPGLLVFCYDYLEIGERIVATYDLLFSSLPYDLFEQIFFIAENLLRKKLLSVWCPHGNSDKGYASYSMEGLSKEKILLVYGKKMSDMIEEKGGNRDAKKIIPIGNFRYSFYQKMAPFYDRLLKREILSSLPPGAPTILYAPTWQDAENSCSFFDAFPHLVENLPDSYNLLVKLHPNLKQDLYKMEKIIYEAAEKPNLLILEEFPPIYPLLHFASIYIGDMSSIGYDFLTFNKPMFFLNQNGRDCKQDRGLYLFQCGVSIEREEYDQIFPIVEEALSEDREKYETIRKRIYSYTFGPEESEPQIQDKINKQIQEVLDEQIDLF